MTYTVVSVIGMDVYVVMNRIVSQCRLQCCRMAGTIYQGLRKLFPPTWQHHHLIIASTTVSIIQWHMISGVVDQYGKALIPNPNDQNPWAHWRSPMDMMRQGWSTSLFHAAQQWSTRSS